MATTRTAQHSFAGAVYTDADQQYQHPLGGVVDSTIAASAGSTLPESVIYNGGAIPSTSVLHYAAGTHTGSGNSATLTTELTLTLDEYVGLKVINSTDGSTSIITGNTSGANSVITGVLSGGTDDDWDVADVYAIVADIDNPDVIGYDSPVNLTSESVAFAWDIYDDSTSTLSSEYTQTTTVTGAPDGLYSVSLSALGVPTITEVPCTVASTGTIPSIIEADLVSTGGTVILTITGDTFIAAGTGPIGTTAQSNALVAAITSAQAEAGGWNATVRDVLDNTDLVRTSDTVATLTVPATAGYAITVKETVTPVVQAAILSLNIINKSASAFTINVDAAASSDGLAIIDCTSDIYTNVTSNVV